LVDKRALLKADSHWSAPPEKADDQEVALIQAVSTCETVKTGLRPRLNARRMGRVCLFPLLHILKKFSDSRLGCTTNTKESSLLILFLQITT
jgi:hypothetical protein